MKNRTFRALAAGLLLLSYSMTGFAQEPVRQKPETIATVSKLVISKVRVGEGDAYEIRGKAVFSITAANSDNTVTGNLVYTIPEEARQKLVQLSGKPLNQIPATTTVKDLNGEVSPIGYDANAPDACAIVHLNFSALQMEIAGTRAFAARFTLDINNNGRDIEKYFCGWRKYIARMGKAPRGTIARINMLLTGESEEQQ